MKDNRKILSAVVLALSFTVFLVSSLYGLGIIPASRSNYLPIVVQEAQTSSAAPSLKQGVNLAGDFEVEPRGDWGTKIEAGFFDLAAEDFDHIRLPIRWSAHTGPAPDFIIDEPFFVEVDWVLDQAERVGLTVVIDVHHFEELDNDPNANRAELIAIWRQIATRYAEQPATVVFELLNEPQGAFNENPDLWNEISAETLAAIRETNPTRLVIIGPVDLNHPSALPALRLPDDPNLMATIHVYDPSEFTHQGAVWADPPPPTGMLWQPNDAELDFNWQLANWDSIVTSAENGFEVAFERQYAAFGVKRLGNSATSFATVTLEVDEAFDAAVLCNWEDGVVVVEFGEPIASSNGALLSADISSCGTVEQIAIQLTSETLVSPILRRIDLCAAGDSGDDCERVIVSAESALDRQFKRAADWAAANGVDLYLGEFGVYDYPPAPVDRASRAAWIRSMRVSAESHNLGWAFFELSNEFGVYTHAASEWNEDMLSALFD